MPDQVVPTLSSQTPPTPPNQGTDQSLDDILKELEEQYKTTTPTPAQAKTEDTKPAMAAQPVSTPQAAPVLTPPPIKPLTEVPKFEVKEHTITQQPPVEKVKPSTPPVVELHKEQTSTPQPVVPPAAKGTGFAAMEETKNTTPNEFDIKPTEQPITTVPPKMEEKPASPPPKKMGGLSNVAKVVGGVVAVLMLIAGTFAVNTLVTQPQDIRQQAGYCHEHGSDTCTSPGASGVTFCKNGDVYSHSCGTEGQNDNPPWGCWYDETTDPVDDCDDATERCVNGACQSLFTGTCEDPCPLIIGPGGSGPSTTYYCNSFYCAFSNDANHICAKRCDIDERQPGVPVECYDRQIDYESGGYILIPKSRTDCSPTVTTNAASCTAKKAYRANGCTSTDCPSKTPLAENATIQKGDLIIYETVVTTTSGTADNPQITDTLDNNFIYVAGDAECSNNANVVTCTKGSSLANGQTWSPKILVEVGGRSGIRIPPPLPATLSNTATFVSSNAGTNTCSITLRTITVTPPTVSCTSLTLNPSSPEPYAQVTAMCLGSENATHFQFRRSLGNGQWENIGPTTNGEYLFVADPITSTVQCAACLSADPSTCTPYENPEPQGVCTKVITFQPETLACTGISYTPAAPQLGDDVTITCGNASTFGATRYEFGYRVANSGWSSVEPVASSSNISVPFTVSTSGKYDVRCRACNNTTCTSWDIQ